MQTISHSVNKGWLHFNVPASQAESLLNTEYFEHEHALTPGKWSVACDEYHLPSHIRDHVDYVTPGIKHLGIHKRTVSRSAPWQGKPPPYLPFRPGRPLHGNLSDCDQLVTPQCIAALYGIPEPQRGQGRKNALGIYEEGDFYAQKDLNLFFANFTKWIPQGMSSVMNRIMSAFVRHLPSS